VERILIPSQWELQSTGNTQYLLYDGHGSTRQLANDGTPNVVVDCYGYDAYGVMLGGNPNNSAPAPTSLLYAGEQFDTDAQQYYLRARYYDQNTGRFSRMDPYAGNPQNPQSLHKYLYCHANPVNAIDPSGLFGTFTNIAITISIGAVIGGILGGVITGSWRGALYGALAGAALSGLAILAFLTAGGSANLVNSIVEAGLAVVKTIGAALLTAFLAVLAENVVDVVNGVEQSTQHYSISFMRAFALVCMAAFAYGFIEYGLKAKGLFDKFVSRFIDPEDGELVLSLLLNFGLELTKAIGTGKIFKEPGKFFVESLVSAGATYASVKYDWPTRYAEEHTEELAAALTGFIVGRITEIVGMLI
jgi:RHS repeat-associated protein